ncbi:MAG: NAD-dependent deacylase [Candidatus Aminicenantes bacterium]|nr:NAD-dependent deacylase [Candidatus Aminicenantes bacterium]
MVSLETLAQDIIRADSLVVFTGAGISSESGIPTYRGAGGLWTKYDPNLYANINHFNRDPSYYWNFFKDVRYPLLKKAKPNRAHLVLAELESLGKLKSVVTQNIDGLHQEAGSARVIELHGNTRVMVCTHCAREYSIDEAFFLLEKELPPLCTDCRGVLRPDVILFGEALKPQVLDDAFHEAASCDFLIAIGSSLVVNPAADIPVTAKRGGAKLAIINIDPTPLDDIADYVISEPAGDTLSEILSLVKKSLASLIT